MMAPTGEEELLAVRYPDPATIRLAVPLKQAGIAVLVLLALLGVLSAWRAGSGGPAALSHPITLSTSPATDTAPLPTPVGVAEDIVVMAVVGHVAHPGLVSLTPGARVAEALERAQPLPGAVTNHINLAEKVADGQQVVVPGPGEPLPAPAHAGSVLAETDGGKVNINTATVEQLMALPGVGEVTAQAIITHRETHGPFRDVGQLQQVKGIGPAKFAALEPEVTV